VAPRLSSAVGYSRRPRQPQASRLPREASRRGADYLAPRQSAGTTIRRFQPYRNAAGTVCGFFDVEFASGLVVNGCKLMIGPAGKILGSTTGGQAARR
jgi:hypothetical protein